MTTVTIERETLEWAIDVISALSGPGDLDVCDDLRAALAAQPVGCNTCPHDVGDTYQRDCCYPDCAAQPAPAAVPRARFPVMLRKMWSGQDVQDWIDANIPATQPAQVPAWQPIETAPKGRIVLIHYKNQLGNGRTMRARYYLDGTLESEDSDSGYAEEGWYEESEAYEYLMPLEHEPTNWMPLPAAPGDAP